MSVGVVVGLVIGIYLAFIYLYRRYKKEDLKQVFISHNCSNKNKVYVYWSTNTSPSKRPVAIYINDELVGSCKRGSILELKKPKTEFVIYGLLPDNSFQTKVENSDEAVYILVDRTGITKRYYLEV